jgi:hypothetical protein
MLQMQLADSFAQQRAQQFRAEARHHQLAHEARLTSPHRSLRTQLGWWLVDAGLRLAASPPGHRATTMTLARAGAGPGET